MAIQTYQIHATLQVISLALLILGSYSANKHRLRMHHRFQYSASVLSTLAVSLMIYESRGLPSIHGRVGFSVFLGILLSVTSGRLFFERTSVLGKKMKRNQHKIIALTAVALLGFQIMNGLFSLLCCDE